MAVDNPHSVPGNFVDVAHFINSGHLFNELRTAQGGPLGGIYDRIQGKRPEGGWTTEDIYRHTFDRTVGVEKSQEVAGKRFREGKGGKKDRGDGASAWSPEDLVSNNLGIGFAAYNLDCGEGAAPLSEQIEDFFEGLGETDPRGRSNYDGLPPNELAWQDIWDFTPDRAEQMKRDYWNP